MLLNLNEQKVLINKRTKRKIFIRSLVINFIVFTIVIMSLSNTWSTDITLLEESRRVNTENKQLKHIIETTLLNIDSKNDSLYKMGLNITPNCSYYDIDSISVDNLNKKISNELYNISSIRGELEPKWDSIKNVPVFMPILSTDYIRVSDYHGWRKHPILKRWVYHNGIDIVAKHNTNILSTANGVVVLKIRSNRGYGNRIVINHNNGFKTMYAHLNKFNVNVGDTVERGDVIGYMGSTGLSTGTHLHYEIIKNGILVNPIDYLYNIAKK